MRFVVRSKLIIFILAWLLTACQNQPSHLHGATSSSDILNASVSVSFAPDGRLWRLTPTQDSVFLDSSNDYGKSYSKPVRVNSQSQHINVWPENPPIVRVGKSGRIHVLYYADEEQKAASFYSYSDNQGLTFSEPVAISDQVRSARNYMDAMLLDDRDKLYLFWHDMRHVQHDQNTVAGSLSLYYATKDTADSKQFENKLISHDICSCCRTGVAIAKDSRPIILARMVFSDGVRDHALLKLQSDGLWSAPRRIAEDHWQIESCPEHGPALSIDSKGRVHMTWFTLGDNRQGLFYAYTDDDGETVSVPMSFGDKLRLAGHADVLAVENLVMLTWQEFDGSASHIMLKTSKDQGMHWSEAREVRQSTGRTSFPKLVFHGGKVFLSWTSDSDHQLTEIAH